MLYQREEGLAGLKLWFLSLVWSREFLFFNVMVASIHPGTSDSHASDCIGLYFPFWFQILYDNAQHLSTIFPGSVCKIRGFQENFYGNSKILTLRHSEVSQFITKKIGKILQLFYIILSHWIYLSIFCLLLKFPNIFCFWSISLQHQKTYSH
jgi:hypothetical protein